MNKTTGLPAEAKVLGATEDDDRPPFSRDYGRLVHSAGFRRLQGKTQVVPPGESDIFRTRLTHTIEVAQIARSLAYRVCHRVDEAGAREVAAVCEAAGIIHDLGHPPFGHVGERALHFSLEQICAQWGVDFEKLGGYEGNAQSFRQVVWAFSRNAVDGHGLQLMRVVLDGAVKYPWTYRDGIHKWNYYPTEGWAFDWVRQDVPDERRDAQSFEAQIMDWADDVVYATHDLEDWYQSRYVPLAMLARSRSARKELARKIESRLPDIEDVRGPIEELFSVTGPFSDFADLHAEYDGDQAAKQAVQKMRARLFALFLGEARAASESGSYRRHEASLVIPESVRIKNRIIKDVVRYYVLDNHRMATYEHGQWKIVEFLVRTYADLVESDDQKVMKAFPCDTRNRISKLWPLAGCCNSKVEVLRLVADYVAGMTDSFATMMFQRLSGQKIGRFHTLV